MTKTKTLPTTSLGFLQRLSLINLLPQTGGLSQMVLIREVRKKIELTSKDIDELEMKDSVTADGKPNMSYNAKKASLKSYKYDFNDGHKKELRKLLQSLINKQELPENLIDLAVELKCTDKEDAE